MLDPSDDATLAAPVDAERLRLHPLLRAEAATHLAAWPEANRDAAQRAIDRWYGDYMPEVINASPTGYVALTPDEANITGALDWALAHNDDRAATRICDGIRGFWRNTGRTRAGLHYLPLGAAAAGRVAEQSGEREDRLVQAYITGYLGDILNNTGRLGEAEAIFTRDLDLRRSIDDRKGEGLVLSRLGQIALQRGRLEEAEGFFQQSLAIDREVSDRRGEGVVLFYLALIAEQQGDLESAERFHRESLQVAVDMGSGPDIAPSLLELGKFLIVRRGKRDEGCEMLREAARLFDEMGIPGGEDARDALRELGCGE